MTTLAIQTEKTQLVIRRVGIQGGPGEPASSSRIIVSAAPPLTREDGSPLQEKDIWIKTT